MGIEHLSVGDVVTMPSYSRKVPIGDIAFTNLTYRASKGNCLVMMVLGEEPKDGSKPLDPVAVMKQLGWVPEKEGVAEAMKASGCVPPKPKRTRKKK